MIKRYWQAAVEPVWPRLHAACTADITYWMERFADGGLARVLADLHPDAPLWHGPVTYPTPATGHLQATMVPPHLVGQQPDRDVVSPPELLDDQAVEGGAVNLPAECGDRANCGRPRGLLGRQGALQVGREPLPRPLGPELLSPGEDAVQVVLLGPLAGGAVPDEDVAGAEGRHLLAVLLVLAVGLEDAASLGVRPDVNDGEQVPAVVVYADLELERLGDPLGQLGSQDGLVEQLRVGLGEPPGRSALAVGPDDDEAAVDLHGPDVLGDLDLVLLRGQVAGLLEVQRLGLRSLVQQLDELVLGDVGLDDGHACVRLVR